MNFSYKIKAQNGEIIEGKIEAHDESVAVNTLQNKGYLILFRQFMNCQKATLYLLLMN